MTDEQDPKRTDSGDGASEQGAPTRKKAPPLAGGHDQPSEPEPEALAVESEGYEHQRRVGVDRGPNLYEDEEDVYYDEDEHPGDGYDDGYDEEYPGAEQEGRLASLTRAVRSDRRAALLALGVIVGVALLVILAASVLGGSGSQTEEENPDAARVEGGVARGENPDPLDAPAANAGELSVTVSEEDAVEVDYSGSAEAGAGASWSGELQNGPENSATLSLTPAEDSEDSANGGARTSFTSVLSEDGVRSWMGLIKDSSREDGVLLEASQSSDPGSAALDGETPLVSGTYVAKAEGGAYSASGVYRDTLVDSSTIERTYEETFVVGGGEPVERAWRVEYAVSGDAALVPFLIGYEPPEEAASGGSSAGGSAGED